ncbi:hypothetical protein K1719_039505 [Acacia pycnantha]|nr:hypothetical protein K1719_039505 [Acacia pycnantha]
MSCERHKIILKGSESSKSVKQMMMVMVVMIMDKMLMMMMRAKKVMVMVMMMAKLVMRMTQLSERQSTLLNIMGKVILEKEGPTKENNPFFPYPLQQQDAPRRSQRPKKPKKYVALDVDEAIEVPKEGKRREGNILRPYLQKLNQGGDILIEIDDGDITREQLQTLGRRNKLSNRTLLAGKPSSWKVSEWKQQLLPEHIGYNIGDCDLIIGPMLVKEHWFCMALDPSTMNLYVLDSMRTKVYMSKNESSKRKKTTFVNP